LLQVDGAQLPEGVSPSDLRMCAGHPNGEVRILDPQLGASLAPVEAGAEGGVPSANETTLLLSIPLGGRAYYSAEPYGCSGGYCWKACGQLGEWF
ncbi:hypothetical protein LY76DRAFT_524384, partial [Colletotrichum caudatum]